MQLIGRVSVTNGELLDGRPADHIHSSMFAQREYLRKVITPQTVSVASAWRYISGQVGRILIAMSFGKTDIDSVLNSYLEYLRNGHSENAPRFQILRESDREAVIAEAIVFRMLQTINLRPEVHDQPGTGGPDFICCGSRGPLFRRLPEDRFVVEATSLDPNAVTDRSHIPNEVPDDISGGAFGLVTWNIFNKAKDKAPQLSGYEMPRVLAIVSSHYGVSALFNSATAVNALVSDYYWKQEIGSDTVDTGQYVSLQNSVFVKPGPNGTIVACRQSISAILLVAVHRDKSEAWGILHPEPAYPLNIEFLPDLPFVRLATWPIPEGRIVPEWIVAHPRGYSVRHYPVHLPQVGRREPGPENPAC